MKKYMKPALCAMAALMILTGCSKKAADETTGTDAVGTEASGSNAAGTDAPQEDIDPGSIAKLGNYKGLELTRESAEVSDEELDERLQAILAANPEHIEITNRPAKNGDVVNIDYVGLKDGVAFDGGTAEGYPLELGSHTFIDGFEDGLIGATVGEELSLNLTFPENYGNEDLAGQDVVFDVTVNSIEEVKEAVLDDNFVQRMSDFSTVDEFKADTLKDLQEEKETLADVKLENDALQAVMDDTEFDVNQAAVDSQYEKQLDYYTSMIGMYGITLEDYVAAYGMTEDQFKEEMKSIAETTIQQQLLFEAIMEAEKLEIGDEDRQRVADQYGMSLDDMKESYGDELDVAAKPYRVVRFIKDSAVIK